jgi:hypothetical protein
MLRAQNINAGDTITSKRGTKVYIKDEQSGKMQIIAQAFLLDVDCGTGDALRLGAGVEGDYFLHKRASVHLGYTFSYLDAQKSTATTLNKGDNAIKGYSLFEVGGRFHIIDKKSLKKCKTQLSHHGSRLAHFNASQAGVSIPENYLVAKLPARRILALRGGFYHTTTIASTDMNKGELTIGQYGAVKTKDGTILSDVYFTNAHTTGAYIGLSEIFNMWVRIKPMIDEFKGHTYLNGVFKETYADLLLAPTSFDPFVTGGRSYDIEPNTKGSFQTSPIGARIGKRIVYTRKKVNLGFNFEIGDRPEIIGRGYYFACGMSLAFVK